MYFFGNWNQSIKKSFHLSRLFEFNKHVNFKIEQKRKILVIMITLPLQKIVISYLPCHSKSVQFVKAPYVRFLTEMAAYSTFLFALCISSIHPIMKEFIPIQGFCLIVPYNYWRISNELKSQLACLLLAENDIFFAYLARN